MSFVQKYHKPFRISLPFDHYHHYYNNKEVKNLRLNNQLFIVDSHENVNVYGKSKQIWKSPRMKIDANKLEAVVKEEDKKQNQIIHAKFNEIISADPTALQKVHAIKTKTNNLIFSLNYKDKTVNLDIYDVSMDEWTGKFNLGSKYVELIENLTAFISIGVLIEGNQVVSFTHKNCVCVFNLKDHTWNIVESCVLPDYYFSRGLNIFDNAIEISDRDEDFKLICGYAKNTSNNNLNIPHYLLQIIKRYCIFDEIYVYVPKVSQIYGENYQYGFNAWRFPVDILFE